MNLAIACLKNLYNNTLIALPPVLAVVGFVLNAAFWLWLIVTALGLVQRVCA